MKRLISLFLTVVLLATTLSACSLPRFSDKDSTEVVESDGTLTVGQWLMLINNAFGMESYTEAEPYFESVATTSPYYEAVQIATEWEIINVNEPLDVNKKLSWEEALVTLVNAGEFIDIESERQDKINYAIANFDNSISDKMLKKEIQYQNAVVLLATAQEKWANKTYEKNVEEVTFNENIVNLVENVKTDYEMEDNRVIVSSDLVGEINEGDVYVIQSKENPLEYTYCKAESVTVDNGVTYITNSNDDLELDEIFEEVKIQGTVVPTTENTVIYDGNGNLISGSQVYEQMSATDKPNFELVAKAVNKHTFEVDGHEITLSYNLDGELDMEVGVKTKNLLSDKKYGSLNAEASFKISDLEVNHDFDYGIIKGLKYASLKVDYKTTTKFGVKYSKKPIDKVFAPAYSNGNGKFLTNCKRAVLKDKAGLGAKTIASKKVIKICSLNVYNAGIAKVCLDVNLVVAVDGSLTVTVTQSGTVGVEYKKGKLRFIKENTKDADVEIKAQIEATLGFGPALYIIGLKKKVVGLEVQLGVGAAAALKLHLVDSQNHLIEELTIDDTCAEDCDVFNDLEIDADAEAIEEIAKSQGLYYKNEETKVKLRFDTCFDVSVYAILKFGLSDDSYAKKFLGSKVKLTCTVFDKSNAVLLNYHIDNWENGKITWFPIKGANYCTLKFTQFDTEPPTEEATTEEATTELPSTEIQTTEEPTASVEPNPTIGDNSYDVDYGEFLLLTDFSATVKVGGKYSVRVEQLPTGYSLSDIIFVSADPSIANVNVGGIVEGKKGGSTTITVKTSDGKHIAAISITVKDDEKVDFEGVEI